MTSICRRATTLALVTIGGAALAQTYPPPGSYPNYWRDNWTTSYNQPVFGSSFKANTGGYSALGWESTPRSLSLDMPPSTGVPSIPRPPTSGAFYRSMQPAPYEPGGSLLRYPAGRRPPVQYGQLGSPGSARNTGRFLNRYAAPSDPEGLQPLTAAGSPLGPLEVRPLAPLEPLYSADSTAIGSQTGASPGFEIPMFRLPRPGEEAGRLVGNEDETVAGGTGTMDFRLPYAAPGDRRVDYSGEGQSETPIGRPAGPGERGSFRSPTGQPGSAGAAAETAFDVRREPNVYAGMRGRTAQLIKPIGASPLPTLAAPGAEAGRPPLQALASPSPRPPPAEPLRTFVGTEDSALNRYLLNAEVKLKAGDFAQAASMYDMARAIDPNNPLPLVGRSMAKFASGDFMTSATNLFQAIELFSELAYYQVDLRGFIPDLKALDTRRAELERRLQTFDDFRLRFLLGYTEYCSGLEDIGLADMTKAAQYAPPERPSVRRFVGILKKHTASRPAANTIPAAR